MLHRAYTAAFTALDHKWGPTVDLDEDSSPAPAPAPALAPAALETDTTTFCSEEYLNSIRRPKTKKRRSIIETRQSTTTESVDSNELIEELKSLVDGLRRPLDESDQSDDGVLRKRVQVENMFRFMKTRASTYFQRKYKKRYALV